MKFPYKTKLLLFILCCCFYLNYSQSSYIGNEPYKWVSNKAAEIPRDLTAYAASDLVIIREQVQFHFYGSNNEKIVKNVLLKINSKKGLEQLQSYKLPESFDEAYDANLYKQGRRSRIKIPFIWEYRVNAFAARKMKLNKWETVTFNLKFEKLRWIKLSGEYMNDEVSRFDLQGLAVGDVVELYYESDFNSAYGSNLFYFQNAYPKLSCEYSFIYMVDKRFANCEFILPVNISDSLIEKNSLNYTNYNIVTSRFTLKNLKAVNFPANSCEVKQLPHAFADFKYYRRVAGSFPNTDARVFEYDIMRPKNFEWMVYKDTINQFTKIYDKQSAAIRKFAATLPKITNDSTKAVFFKSLCDTFNNFRYISANHMFYNESAIYEVYSGEHLLKRRLTEQALWKVYRDILNENKTFYYVVNVQDRRYGEHTLNYRAHYAYENHLIAVPSNNSYIYFMPRYDGIKYHLNELPFYYEGSLAALTAKNYQEGMENKDSKYFKLIKTHKGTYNENTRTENASVKISLDSATAGLTIKESLSGQFSTVLRHLYLNESIDSTIGPHYFKKCTEKPFATNIKSRLSSKINEYPFRYTFACNEKLALSSNQALSLNNWFSFTLNKNVVPEVPNQDYYFDFEFTDSYNFSLDFGSAVEIINLSAFTKKTSNDYFELDSEIIKNSDSNYLLKVKLAVKQQKLPVENNLLLTELVQQLEELNSFTLSLKRS